MAEYSTFKSVYCRKEYGKKKINENFSGVGDPTLSSLMKKGPKEPWIPIAKYSLSHQSKAKQLYSEHSLVCCMDMAGAATWQLWLHKAHSVNRRSYDNIGPQACLWVCQSRWDLKDNG